MKRKFKIVLDAAMFLLALTLFGKRFVSMNYHEIAGLVLVALIAVHVAANFKTLKAMGKKFAKVPASLKTEFVVDALLLVCFAWLGVSGVLISRTILTGVSAQSKVFKIMHVFCGGLSVILLGVHMGLHVCRKKIPLAAAAVFSAVVFSCGIFGALNSSEAKWISSPVALIQKNSVKQDGQKKSGEKKIKENFSAGQKAKNVVMFSGMIFSCAAATYWIFRPKK